MYKKAKGGVIALAVPALMFVASSAHAVLPTEATAALTALETDGASMVAAGWPIAVAVTVGLILMGIFKKVASRAT